MIKYLSEVIKGKTYNYKNLNNIAEKIYNTEYTENNILYPRRLLVQQNTIVIVDVFQNDAKVIGIYKEIDL